MLKKYFVLAALAAVVALSLFGCTTSQPVALTGAGSSFIFPLMTQMVDQYHSQKSNVTINYQSVGSGAGISQISDQTLDFGATDGPMSDSQLAAAKGGKILHIPLTLGATAVTYNLPGGPQELRLSADTLANIFLGKITKWNDVKIQADNPGVTMPASSITVAHRTEGSGTTYIFSDYLSHVSADWASIVGTATSLNWPVGIGAKGSEGVAGVIAQNPGSIGYVEMAYAVQSKLLVATLQNKDGNWVKPSAQGASAAAAAATIPDDMRVSIVNAQGADAYPIAGFTWGLVYQNQTDKTKGQALVNFLDWAIHDGQSLSEPLNYAKLPANLVQREEALLKTVVYNGDPLLK